MSTSKFRILHLADDFGPAHWTYLTLPDGLVGEHWMAKDEYDWTTWSQWIGLLDKHGVEVYIGDIVKGVTSDYQDKRKQYTRIEQVAYDEDMRLQPFHDIWDYDEHLWMHCLVDGFEVIGNIHEHAHLLGEG